MGLFEKKYCDVCGEKIGLLGNRKLEDANLCKHCASKLSPWFNERRHSTLEQIKEQLDYREENKAAVAAFHTTLSFGSYTKLLIDEDARRFMVTSARNLEEANPDVVDFSQVTGCELDVDENKREITTKDKDGKTVSYNPRRYEYSYDFDIIIRVNNPYFDEMKFQLNGSSVKTGERSINDTHARPGTSSLLGDLLGGVSSPAQGGNRFWNAEYQEYYDTAQTIRQILLKGRQEVREEAAAENAPAKKMTCPFCQATTTPDASGCCEFCGSVIVSGK